MKTLAAGLAVIAALSFVPMESAQAKGCIKGAVAGGIAGHYLHHHAVLGAITGCIVGHHLANRHPDPHHNNGH
jgi:hypothetical protein